MKYRLARAVRGDRRFTFLSIDGKIVSRWPDRILPRADDLTLLENQAENGADLSDVQKALDAGEYRTYDMAVELHDGDLKPRISTVWQAKMAWLVGKVFDCVWTRCVSEQEIFGRSEEEIYDTVFASEFVHGKRSIAKAVAIAGHYGEFAPRLTDRGCEFSAKSGAYRIVIGRVNGSLEIREAPGGADETTPPVIAVSFCAVYTAGDDVEVYNIVDSLAVMPDVSMRSMLAADRFFDALYLHSSWSGEWCSRIAAANAAMPEFDPGWVD